MDISIIIPVYNSASTLRQCLLALNNSSFSDFEVLVVDDKSEDDSVSIARKFPCKVILLDENMGPAGARNEGVRQASGEILLFVDSDMVVHEDAVERIVNTFEKKPDVSCVSGIYSKKPLLSVGLTGWYRCLQTHYWKKSTVGYTTRFTISLGAIKRDVFEAVGGFDEEYKKADVEDYEIGHRLVEKGFKLFQDPLIQADHRDISSFPHLLSTVFRRGRMWMSLFFKRRRLDKGYVTPGRSFGLILSLVSLMALLGSVVFPSLIYTACFSIILFLISDGGFLWFLLREQGTLSFIPLVVIHYFTSLARAFGAVAGTFDYITSK